MKSQDGAVNLEDFVDLLGELRGVIEVKVWMEDEEAYVGLRTGLQRPPHVLLQQVSRAATGFGFKAGSVHFGLLAD